MSGAVIVCIAKSEPLMFPENKCAVCRDCGNAVQYHPTSIPPGMDLEDVRFICMPCGADVIENTDKPMTITEATLAFVKQKLSN